jgi:hypothetical protein
LWIPFFSLPWLDAGARRWVHARPSPGKGTMTWWAGALKLTTRRDRAPQPSAVDILVQG